MIPINRETMLIVGVIICAAGIIFLFNELKKTKEEVNEFKGFSEQVVKRLNAPAPKVEEVEEEEVKSEE
jgi:hypothetical protein